MEFKGALSGLKILAVTQAYAGPFAAQMLADHGADVVKIEGPEGDPGRLVTPFPTDDKNRYFGALFQNSHRNQRAIVIDFKTEEGRETFLKLVETADAVIENFRFGVMERLGLGYEVLKARNPKLVYTSIRGFGDKPGGLSPYAPYPTVDVIAQAMGGIMSVTGPDAEHPTKIGGGYGDTIPGLFAAYGTMVALWEAQKSGEGQYVDIAMVDSILAMTESVSTFYSYWGRVPVPTGNRMPEIAPFGTIRCKDGFAAIAVPPGRHWALFCEIIGRPELGDDPKFNSIPARVKNMDEVYEIVEAFTMPRTKAELLEIFGNKMPFAPIYDAADVHHDPHFKVRDMLPSLPHPGSAGEFTVPGIPTKLSRTPGAVRHRAPKLGEHTEQVLAQNGFTPEQIAKLKALGAIGQFED